MEEFKDICWQLFKKTGGIEYYMLYKAIANDETELNDYYGTIKNNGDCNKIN